MTAGTASTSAWEMVAQWPGGTVAAMATATGASGQSVTLAATAAGLHVSTDGGQHWRWISLAPDPTPECLAVASRFDVDPTVLLGTSSGLHRSADGGMNWRTTLVGSRVQCIAATPGLAEGGTVLVGTETDGILRSDDGGINWIGANAGLLDLNVAALAISPTFEKDRTAFAGTASGLFRSRNGGRAWRLVEVGPEAPAVQCLAVSPGFAEDGLVLAGTEADGLFRSDDSGQIWDKVGSFPEQSVISLAFASDDGHAVIAGTIAGVAISNDGGQTWTLDASAPDPTLSLAVSGDTMLAGTIGLGIIRRTADGSGWSSANDGLAGRATVDMQVTTAFGDEPLIAVATLDVGVLLSHDAGRTWKTGHAGLTSLSATSLALVRQASGQPALLATFPDGVYRTDDIEAGWQRIDLTGLGGPDATVSASPTCLSVVGDLSDGPSTVLAAGPRVLAISEDAGLNWRSLPLPAPDAEIVTVSPSPDMIRDQTIYVAVRATQAEPDGTLISAGLDLWRTTDLGRRWSRWLQTPEASVMPIAVPRTGVVEASVLVGQPGRVSRPLPRSFERRQGERRPLWQEARVGAAGETVTALAVSPFARRDGTLLAAAGSSVYVSRDGGVTFEAWADGLEMPLVTAVSLISEPDGSVEAYALGLGGTLWRRRVA